MRKPTFFHFPFLPSYILLLFLYISPILYSRPKQFTYSSTQSINLLLRLNFHTSINLKNLYWVEEDKRFCSLSLFQSSGLGQGNGFKICKICLKCAKFTKYSLVATEYHKTCLMTIPGCL